MESIFGFLNGKGGVGKSSCARMVAVERARVKGKRVLIADMNTNQWSTWRWGSERKTRGFLPVVDVEKMELEDIQDLLDQEEKVWGPRQRALEKQDAEYIGQYEGRVQKLGALLRRGQLVGPERH